MLCTFVTNLIVATLVVAAVAVVEDTQSAKPLSYNYYPNVVVKMNECLHPVYAVLFTGDYYPDGLCERHRCFINDGKQGHLEVTRCPPPQIRGCWPLNNETQPYPRCCKHVMMCIPGLLSSGDHGSFSVVEASPSELQMRLYRQPRRNVLTYHF